MKKLISIFLVLLSFNLIAKASDIVALVNDKPITKYEFDSRKKMIIVLNRLDVSNIGAETKLNSDVINMLVEEELLYQHMLKVDGAVNSDEVDDAIRTIEQRNNMPKNGMKAHMIENNLDFNSFRRQIKSELIKQNIIGSLSRSVSVSPNELDVALVNSYQDFSAEAWVFTSKKIDEKSKKKMQKLKDSLKDCNSIDEKLYDEFADAEKFDRKLSLFPSEIQSIIMDNKVGGISNVNKINGAYQVVFVCKKESSVSEQDVDKVKAFLSSKKMSQKAVKFFKDMKLKADIKIMIPN